MVAFKATILFNAGTVDSDGNAARSAGFSESVYDNTSPNVDAVKSKLNQLCIARAALMPANVRIIGQRIQQVDPKGASISFDSVYIGSSTAQNDLPQAALQWTVRGSATPNQRALILRGMPDARIVTGEYNPTAAFNAALNAYFTRLLNDWQFKAIDRTVLPVKIATITALGVMTTQTNHGLANGDAVNIMSSNSTGDVPPTKYSYSAVAYEVTAKTAQLVLPGRTDQIFASAGGRVRKAGVIYPSFAIRADEITTPTAITRKAGSPFKKFVGRRTVRR